MLSISKMGKWNDTKNLKDGGLKMFSQLSKQTLALLKAIWIH